MISSRSERQIIVDLLTYLGENPTRPGLFDTPVRVLSAWREMTAGYLIQDPTKLLTLFDDEKYDEMVIVRDIPFVSCCEHHLLPFIGVAHIGYLPKIGIVGLSKLARLVDCFAKRLQVQERMQAQIADTLMQATQARGCGVVLEARHLCMEIRGVKKPNVHTVTSALRGCFKTDPAVRAEFLQLVKK